MGLAGLPTDARVHDSLTTRSAPISIAEWTPANLNWTSALAGLSPRDPDNFLLLLWVAALAIPIALLRRQPGAAVLLSGAAFLGIRYVRFQALSSAVLVVIGGSVLTSAWRTWQNAIRDSRIKVILKVGLCCLAVVFTCAWSADVISDRTYLRETNLASFGTGLSWWFPEGAASFLERENIPGQVFNSYDEGGYIAWRLGPKHLDYVDGRGDPFGTELVRRSGDLLGSLPDSSPGGMKQNVMEFSPSSPLWDATMRCSFSGLAPVLRQ